MRDIFVYAVSGTVEGQLRLRFLDAMSPRQACYRFCREFDLSEAGDVPGLRATNIFDENDTYSAENNGILG